MIDKYRDLKQECYDANMALLSLELVIYTFGNVSAVDRSRGLYAIKPSGVPYEQLQWQDMVIVDFDNKIVEGRMRPSSDTKTHSVLYRNFADIGGIVHTHSTYAVAWAQARRPVPIYGTTHADHLNCDIPCTEVMADARIVNDYEEETGNQILETFRNRNLNPAEVQMVLVACHGPFAWGKNAAQAVYNAKVFEELCKMALFTEQIAPSPERMKPSLIQKHYERKHGKNAYYGQKQE